MCESGACCTVFRAECTARSLQGILSFLPPDIFHFDLGGASVPITPYHQLYPSPDITPPLLFSLSPYRNVPSHPYTLSFKYSHVSFRQYRNTNSEPIFVSICLCANQEGVDWSRGIAPLMHNLSTAQRRVDNRRPQPLYTVSSLSR